MPKITLEDDLYARARTIAEKAGYSSVDEFVAHILERELNPPDAQDSDAEILERLRGLGYIS